MSAPTRNRSAATVFIAALLVVGGIALDPKPAIPAPTVEAELDAGGQTSLGRFVVTARWGRTQGPGVAGATEAAATTVWDGYIAIDCGRILSVTPLALEAGDADGPGTADVLSEGISEAQIVGRGAKIAFRSSTHGDWDGMRAVVAACDDRGEDSMLTIHTAQRRFAARLAWSADDFIALPVGTSGDALEIHTRGELDPHRQGGSRVTDRGGDTLAMR
jgi:hypothetical protein